jgi:hypothetical protein
MAAAHIHKADCNLVGAQALGDDIGEFSRRLFIGQKHRDGGG